MAQLELISGVVQNLKSARGSQDLVFTQTDKDVAGAAATGAAVMGEAFSAANLASTSMGGAEIGMDFFTCTVNGILLEGGFYRLEFKEGESVDFVVERETGRNIVKAARSPEQRIIWMLPHQERGQIAQKRSNIKWMLILSALAAAVLAVVEFYRFPKLIQGCLHCYILSIFGAFLLVFVVMGYAFWRLYGFSKEATEVIEALGYQNPAEVDLHSQHKQAQKKLHQETGKLPPLVQPWSFRY
jgi:hypothetical protein